MPSDTSLPGALGWTLWYISELAFKWVPGFIISATGAQDVRISAQPTPPPVITEAASVQDVVQFLQTSSAPGVFDRLYHDWNVLVSASIGISLILSAIFIYALIRVFQIRQTEYRHFQSLAHTVAAGDVPKTRLRWDRILEQASSESDQSRRLAILEADIMLNELLDEQGYRGETMADKMRQADRTHFNTIDLAWEAHRARNRVAHEAAHNLSAYDVQQIIGMYEKVFREFGFAEK